MCTGLGPRKTYQRPITLDAAHSTGRFVIAKVEFYHFEVVLVLCEKEWILTVIVTMTFFCKHLPF
jgi:hypothetical protein